MKSSFLIRKLSRPEEFEEFCAGYWKSFARRPIVSQAPLLPPDVASFTNVFGAFADGKMRAGYVLNKNQASFRNLHTLTLEERSAFVVRINTGKMNVVEISSLWKDEEFRQFKSRLWPHIFLEVMKSSVTHVLGAVYPKHGMAENYLKTRPEILHLGNGSEDRSVFLYKKSQFLWTIILAFVKQGGHLAGAIRELR